MVSWSRWSVTNAVKLHHANNAAAVCHSARFGDSHGLGWKVTEVLSHFQLHAVDLGQKSRSGGAVIHGIGLSLTEMG